MPHALITFLVNHTFFIPRFVDWNPLVYGIRTTNPLISRSLGRSRSVPLRGPGLPRDRETLGLGQEPPASC